MSSDATGTDSEYSSSTPPPSTGSTGSTGSPMMRLRVGVSKSQSMSNDADSSCSELARKKSSSMPHFPQSETEEEIVQLDLPAVGEQCGEEGCNVDGLLKRIEEVKEVMEVQSQEKEEKKSKKDKKHSKRRKKAMSEAASLSVSEDTENAVIAPSTDCDLPLRYRRLFSLHAAHGCSHSILLYSAVCSAHMNFRCMSRVRTGFLPVPRHYCHSRSTLAKRCEVRVSHGEEEI